MKSIAWWMRESTDEIEWASKFCSHLIAPCPSPGAWSSTNKRYVQSYYIERWERYYKALYSLPDHIGFISMSDVYPSYATTDWWKKNPINERYFAIRRRKIERRLARANSVRNTTSMDDWEVYGDAKDRYKYHESDPIEVARFAVLAGYSVDIAFPYTDYRELYSLNTRFAGRSLMGTQYSPHHRPAKEGSAWTQIIVVTADDPNPNRRFTPLQTVEFIRSSEINVMLFPNGDSVAVAKELSVAMRLVVPQASVSSLGA